ncbi:GNAT family N-acetyltransferase [bacterium]|nr:GNAT family N-acetyltransferase [bacterium]
MNADWIIEVAQAADRGTLIDLLTRQLVEHDLPADLTGIARAVDGILDDERLGFLLVARAGHEVVGVAYVARHWSLEHGGPACWLEELYVLPDRRCRGVGVALVRAACERARALGCLVMDLEVTADHARAENLYQREGFRELGRRRWARGL